MRVGASPHRQVQPPTGEQPADRLAIPWSEPEMNAQVFVFVPRGPIILPIIRRAPKCRGADICRQSACSTRTHPENCNNTSGTQVTELNRDQVGEKIPWRRTASARRAGLLFVVYYAGCGPFILPESHTSVLIFSYQSPRGYSAFHG